MKLYGCSTYLDVKDLIESDEAKRLEPENVEFGEVVVIEETKNEEKTQGTLILYPRTRIKDHFHPKDNEKYSATVIKNGKKIEVSETCLKGQHHDAENLSYGYFLVIRFTKWL